MKNKEPLSVLNVTQLVFLILKLTSLITWSWWWVASPAILQFIAGMFLYILRKKNNAIH